VIDEGPDRQLIGQGREERCVVGLESTVHPCIPSLDSHKHILLFGGIHGPLPLASPHVEGPNPLPVQIGEDLLIILVPPLAQVGGQQMPHNALSSLGDILWVHVHSGPDLMDDQLEVDVFVVE